MASFIGESNIIHKSDFEHFFIDMNGAEKVCIRPQDFRISDNGPIWGEVTGVNFNGGHINYRCSVNGCGIKISEMNLYNKAIMDVGQNVSIQIDKNAVEIYTGREFYGTKKGNQSTSLHYTILSYGNLYTISHCQHFGPPFNPVPKVYP